MPTSFDLGANTFLDATAVTGYKGNIASTANLDDYCLKRHCGIYYAQGVSILGSTHWGMFIVLANGVSSASFVTQVLINKDEILARDRSGNPATWRAWTKMGAFGNMLNQDKSNLTVTSGTTWQELDSYLIPAGTWLIDAAVRYNSNATGRRGCSVSLNQGQGGNVLRTQALPAVSGTETTVTINSSITSDGTTTIYLMGYQNSGSSLGAATRIKLTRIA